MKTQIKNDYGLMQNLFEEMRTTPYVVDKTELKRLRSAILHRLQKHGIDTTNWSKTNTFMRQSRIAGKTLGEMTIDEMQRFIPKLESILGKDKTKQKEIERLAQLN